MHTLLVYIYIHTGLWGTQETGIQQSVTMRTSDESDREHKQYKKKKQAIQTKRLWKLAEPNGHKAPLTMVWLQAPSQKTVVMEYGFWRKPVEEECLGTVIN